MRLTPNALLAATSTINTNGDRTLSLRSLQLPLLEHLSTLGDIHEVIDLTDNDIRILGNFPLLLKVRTVLLARNRVSAIQHDVAQFLPQLESLSLVQNNVKSVKDLAPLRKLKRLHSLYLTDNEVTKEENYRLLVIWLLPQLCVLDFNKIKNSEREQSSLLYGTFENPPELAKSLFEHQPVVQVMDVDKETQQVEKVLKKLTPEEREVLKTELKNATSLDEIDRIENALKSGYL
jgi:U2 small nuclear ribonucleoprotein A'